MGERDRIDRGQEREPADDQKRVAVRQCRRGVPWICEGDPVIIPKVRRAKTMADTPAIVPTVLIFFCVFIRTLPRSYFNHFLLA
jgi:hypothetical protein